MRNSYIHNNKFKKVGNADQGGKIMEKKNERIEEEKEKRRAEIHERIEKRKAARAFTSEKRTKLIDKLNELLKTLWAAKVIYYDVQDIMPRGDVYEEDNEMAISELRLNAMHKQLDFGLMAVAEYLKNIKKEENEDDGSSG